MQWHQHHQKGHPLEPSPSHWLPCSSQQQRQPLAVAKQLLSDTCCYCSCTQQVTTGRYTVQGSRWMPLQLLCCEACCCCIYGSCLQIECTILLVLVLLVVVLLQLLLLVFVFLCSCCCSPPPLELCRVQHVCHDIGSKAMADNDGLLTTVASHTISNLVSETSQDTMLQVWNTELQ